MSDIDDQLSTLCEVCLKVFSLNPDNDTEYSHHPNLEALRQAKEGGCSLCNVIWDSIQDHHEGEIVWRRRKIFDQPPVMLQFYSKNHEKEEDWRVDLGIGPLKEYDNSDGDEPCSRKHTPGTKTDSPETWRLINHWLHDCISNHTGCTMSKRDSNSSRNNLPDRIIDVGKPGDATVRLRCAVDMNPEERTSRYLTLSHRWPKGQLISLTDKTLASFKRGIPISDLPKTFQDAAQATRQLKERFLWIDSLCIMQDSVSDWREQAAKMGSIYMYGLCNLAATAASDSTGGLFFDRNVAAIHHLRVRCNWTFLGPIGRYPHTSGGLFRVDDFLLLNKMVEHTELNTRAWVFQERLLSPRIVHFAQNQLVWECRNGRACEMYPDGAPNGPGSIAKWSHFWPIKTFAQELTTKGAKTHRDWRLIVQRYSGLDLTKRKDVLVALSGLAKLMQNAMGDEYLAGLWETTIAHDLLWERTGRIAHRQGDATDIGKSFAPTWSWAFLDYQVAWDNFQEWATEIHMTLLRSDFLPIPAQTFIQEPTPRNGRDPLTGIFRNGSAASNHGGGESNSGIGAASDSTRKLYLKGRIFKVPCSKNKRYVPMPSTNPENKVIEVVISGHTYPAWVIYDNPQEQDVFFIYRDTFPASYGEFQFMPVAYCPIEAYGYRWYGLILKAGEDLPDHYRRTGRLEILMSPDQLAEALRSGDRGGQLESFDSDLQWLITLQGVKAFDNLDMARHGYECEITLV
ncbi:hypothetical protein VC83_02788 [Pseudogymnoascus destructans]|uniref:Heterokaryon incompatibility domain-containing protein n=2 Tax=Pseudogymnoascus destructans TaxID=655981 RepID=L8FYW3_PSED2|nr:uncharacterized protein VC83_02788 [Pseudogymnoascus destructans]ELR04906.1 hypothetical protein GMDG_00165 [Pseudogymnoascus destructans 20631-21]OAF60147.1 hypothetical protein VC83_02788 [Pseudogymnoascus destructans]